MQSMPWVGQRFSGLTILQRISISDAPSSALEKRKPPDKRIFVLLI